MVDFADFVVTAPDDSVQLAVEAKRHPGADPMWAAAFRRNLFAHASGPRPRFFLLALPDRFYLWKDAPTGEPAPPQYTADARRELAPYLGSLRADPAALSGEGFELLVQAWLSDMVTAAAHAAAPGVTAPRPWLADSGLWDVLRTGRLRTPAAPRG